MKTKFACTLIALGALALGSAIWAKDDGKKRDADQAKVAKPTPASGGGAKNAQVAKPGGGGGGGGAKNAQVAKPGVGGGGGGAGGDRKVPKPSGGGGSGTYRPSIGEGQKPVIAKPPGGGARLPVAKPANRPEVQPQHPAGSGGGLPSYGGTGKPKLPDRPATLPGGQPGGGGGKPKPVDRPSQVPGQKPGQKPDGSGDFLDLRPDKPNRPVTLPGDVGQGKPNIPGSGNHPGGKPDRPGGKPDHPTTLPGNVGDGKPNRPGPGNRPGYAGNDRPNRPNLDHRPGHQQRPPRPDRPGKWQSVQYNNVNQWNQWKQDNSVHINNFQVNRTNNWNNIDRHYHERDWAGRYHSDEYWGWRRDVFDYRRHRGEEIWDRRQDYWDDAFDQYWWDSCWWRRRPAVAWSVDVSPWWWWRPFAWGGARAFFGATLDPQPVYYDPGTTAIYEGDTYYINGEPSGTAIEARQAAIQLATPAVEEMPVPEPVAEGQPEAWLPLGVWALTQQEQGDATMFMQFSVDKNGLLAGAYKNVMTGDEQPLIGQLDKKTQRVAWHVGEATQTVYETGFANLENDVVSVFVHFGEKQTQTWLLVRLPSPEMPPGTVKLPEAKKE